MMKPRAVWAWVAGVSLLAGCGRPSTSSAPAGETPPSATGQTSTHQEPSPSQPVAGENRAERLAALRRTIFKFIGYSNLTRKGPDDQIRYVMQLHSSGPSDEQLKELAEALKDNQTPNKITDASLEHLEALPKLRSVNLSRTKVTATGAKKLKQERSRLYVSGP